MRDIVGVAGTKKRYIAAIARDMAVRHVLLGCVDGRLYKWCQIIAWHRGEALLGAGNGEEVFDNSGHIAIFVDDIGNPRGGRVVCIDIELGHFGRRSHNTKGCAELMAGIGDKASLLFVGAGCGGHKVAR